MKLKNLDANARFANTLLRDGEAYLRNVSLVDTIGLIKLAVALGCYPVCTALSAGDEPGTYNLTIKDTGSEEAQISYVKRLIKEQEA